MAEGREARAGGGGGEGRGRSPAARRRKWLRAGITVGLVLIVGGVADLAEHHVEHALPEVRERIHHFNEVTRGGLRDLVPLKLVRVFFGRLLSTPCTCGGTNDYVKKVGFVNCDAAPGFIARVCQGQAAPASLFSLTALRYRFVAAGVETVDWVGQQPLLNIILFALSFVLAIALTWDDDHVIVTFLMSIVVASLIALVLWAIAWLLSALALLFALALAAVVLPVGGFKLLEHYVVHPLEEKLAHKLGASDHHDGHDEK